MALLLQLTQKLAHGFTAFWARYPNRTAKKDAEKAWDQVVKTPQIEAEIHTALDWQIPHWQTLEWYHPPYPATYLRKERFRDEPPAPKPPTPSAPAPWQTVTAAQQQQLDASRKIKELIKGGMDRHEAIRQVSQDMGWTK